MKAMIGKVKVISICDMFTAVGDFFTYGFSKIIAIFTFLFSPFSIEKKDGKIVFSISFKPIPKIEELVNGIGEFISIRKNAKADYVLRVSIGRLGYICIRPIPTSTSGAYAYISPNGELYTATWYIGGSMEDAIATKYIRHALGHGYTLTMTELGTVCNIRTAVRNMHMQASPGIICISQKDS